MKASSLVGGPVPEAGHDEAGHDEAAQGLGVCVRHYRSGLDDLAWDELVGRAVNGTFLHTRRFLSYHGGRFRDCSLVVEDRSGRICGVLPAAADPSYPRRVVSHPGITYGSLVHDGSLHGSRMVAALGAACQLFASDGATCLRYKAVPGIYHSVPAGDDLYALFRMGARCVSRDLSATIDLANRRPARTRRLRYYRTAETRGISLAWGWDAIGDCWPIEEEMLADRFGIRPTHTLDEIDGLARSFPDNIRLVVARIGGQVVAGAIAFCAPPVFHLQYLASGEAGRRSHAGEVVVEETIQAALRTPEIFRYYSFGISTEHGGWRLNDSLHEFKVTFGAGAVVYEQFELDL